MPLSSGFGKRTGPPGHGRIDTGKVIGGKEGEEIIAVDNVKRRFGDFYAVKGISFTVRRGEVFGLLGANGAGKSTTFRMLCGLLPASEGSLHVAGRDLLHAAAKARNRIGYMAQKFSLYGDLSVRENLRFFASIYGLRNKIRKDRIDWAISEFELEEYANAASRDLPLGFKQRLALARRPDASSGDSFSGRTHFRCGSPGAARILAPDQLPVGTGGDHPGDHPFHGRSGVL